MKKTLALLFLLAPAIANGQSFFGGLSGSIGKENAVGVSAEFGYSLLDSGISPAASIEGGMIFNAPEHEGYSLPFAGEKPKGRNVTLVDGNEIVATVNLGVYFPFGLGVFGSIGATRVPVIGVRRVGYPAYDIYNDERAVIFGNFGGDLRYKSQSLIFRVGYANRRGVVIGLGSAL